MKRHKTASRTLLPILCALITGFSGITGTTKSYGADLWDIYQLALANDSEYQAALFSHESARLSLPIAKSAFRPSIIGGVQFGSQQSDSSGTAKTGDDHAVNLNVQLPLYDKSKRVEVTQSRYQVEISEWQLLDAKQRLILRVANRYFNLLAAQDAREVAHLEKVAIKRQMDLTSKRLEVGLGTRADLYDAQARFKLAEADEIRTQNQINNDIALLKQLIGVTPEILSTLNDSAPLELPSPDDVDAWTEQSVEHNALLKAESLKVKVALQEMDIYKIFRL